MTNKIAARSIRSVNRLKTLARGVKNVHLVRALEDVQQAGLERIGFSSEPGKIGTARSTLGINLEQLKLIPASK